MRIDILTIFPAMFEVPMQSSIIGIAQDKGLLSVNVHDLRNWTTDKHRTVDDIPYGGGAGMVMKPEPLFLAVEELSGGDIEAFRRHTPVILMSPKGKKLNHNYARELAEEQHLLIICGRYEGVDERVCEHLANSEISIGDYVLSGGELPAMVIVDAVARLIPEVLGAEESLLEESFSSGLLEYPQYTRPAEYRDLKVPEVLLSGHHAEIAKWRRQQSLIQTAKIRPELLETAEITDAEREWLAEQGAESSLAPWTGTDSVDS